MVIDEFIGKVLENVYNLSIEDIEFLEDEFPYWHKCFFIEREKYWKDVFDKYKDEHLKEKAGYFDYILTLVFFEPAFDLETALKMRDEARRKPKIITLLKKSEWWNNGFESSKED